MYLAIKEIQIEAFGWALWDAVDWLSPEYSARRITGVGRSYLKSLHIYCSSISKSSHIGFYTKAKVRECKLPIKSYCIYRRQTSKLPNYSLLAEKAFLRSIVISLRR